MLAIVRSKRSRVRSMFSGIQGVMLDRGLAEFYGLKTKALKQAVRRKIGRFPEDFMFELTKKEFQNWRPQFVTSNRDKMDLRYSPDGWINLLNSI